MNKMKKLQIVLYIINSNRMIFALFSIILSMLLVIGSTYAWIIYSDEKINQVKSPTGKLDVSIKEKFNMNLSFTPGETTINELSVKSDGEMVAIVRLSLYEFLANFERGMTDGEGKSNGRLKTVESINLNQLATFEDFGSWEVGKYYKIKREDQDKYIKIAVVDKSNKNNPLTAYKYTHANSNDLYQSEKFSYLTIGFNNDKIYTKDKTPPNRTTNYWYYSEGYFYYSEVLKKSDETEKLINNISLAGNLPNKYRGSFYQLVPVMEAHDITKSLKEDWAIASSSDSYLKTMYNDKLK